MVKCPPEFHSLDPSSSFSTASLGITGAVMATDAIEQIESFTSADYVGAFKRAGPPSVLRQMRAPVRILLQQHAQFWREIIRCERQTGQCANGIFMLA